MLEEVYNCVLVCIMIVVTMILHNVLETGKTTSNVLLSDCIVKPFTQDTETFVRDKERRGTNQIFCSKGVKRGGHRGHCLSKGNVWLRA